MARSASGSRDRARSSLASRAQHPGADTELHYHNAVRAAGGDDPLRAVHRRAREHRSRRRCSRAIRDARALAAGQRRRRSSRISFHRLLPGEGAVAHRHGAGARRASTAARCRPTWRRSSSCRASAARPRTSCSATRSACPACRSIGTCCASRTGSASPRSDDPEVVEQQLCAALPPERWTRASDTLILHGRRICRPKPLCDQLRRDAATTVAVSSNRPCGTSRVAGRPKRGATAKKRAAPSPRRAREMTREQFDALVADALRAIPAALPRAMQNLAIVVEDEPSPGAAARDGHRAARHAARPLSGHAADRARLGLRQRAARPHPDLPGAARARVARRGRPRRGDRRDADPRGRATTSA